MEWIETTAKSVEEAKDLALDRLGVDEQEAEFEILEEPRQGIFGRLKGEARIRARVAPVQARAKIERRDRRRGGPRSSEGRSRQSSESSRDTSPTRDATKTEGREETSEGRLEEAPARVAANGNKQAQPAVHDSESTNVMDTTDQEIDLTVDEQADIIKDFLGGLLSAFDLDGEIVSEKVDEDTVEIDIQGEKLGILIGPRGNTLQAMYDLSRTVTQRRASGRHEGRVRLDVAGYRLRRREALEDFVSKTCEAVLETGISKVLEPMSSVDRKIVHDTATAIEGITTSSEGDEPRRRVVIHRAS